MPRFNCPLAEDSHCWHPTQSTRITVFVAIVVLLPLEASARPQASASAEYQRETQTSDYKRATALSTIEVSKSLRDNRIGEAIDQLLRARRLFASTVGENSVEVATVMQSEGELWLRVTTLAGERDYGHAEYLFETSWKIFETLESNGATFSDTARQDRFLSLKGWVRCLHEQGKPIPHEALRRLVDHDLRSGRREEDTIGDIKQLLRDLLWSSDFVAVRQFLPLLQSRLSHVQLQQTSQEVISELAQTIAGTQVDYRFLGGPYTRKDRDELYPLAADAVARQAYDPAREYLSVLEGTRTSIDQPAGTFLFGDVPVVPDELRLMLLKSVFIDRQSGLDADPFLVRTLKLLRRSVGLQAAAWPESSLLAAMLHASAERLWTENDRSARLRALVAGRLTAIQLKPELSTLDNAEQLRLLQRVVPSSTSQLLSMCSTGECLEEAYSLLLSWKGLLVQQMRIEGQFKDNAAAADDVAMLRQARAALAGLFHRPSAALTPEMRTTARKQAFAAKSKAESLLRERMRLTLKELIAEILISGLGDESSHLAGLSIDSSKDISAAGELAGFQGLLSDDEIFIDVYRYGTSTSDPLSAPQDRFGMVVVRRTEKLRFIDAGLASPIEEAIAAWRGDVLAGGSGAGKWETLSALIWAPVAQEIRRGQVTKVWFSPDSELARVPIHLLCGLSCDVLVTQIDSPREFERLRRVDSASIEPKTLFVAGGLDYGTPDALNKSSSFRPLDWTGYEAEKLAGLASTANIRVMELQDRELTKQAFATNASAATYVHLATHGFYVSAEFVGEGLRNVVPISGSQLEEKTFSLGPLMTSGIALSDANTSDPVSFNAPGILTAEELGGVDLSHADLVTLSACETGRGTEVTGQGIIGLRAAIIAAGARSTLLSLWKVPDESTAKFMATFYTALWRDGMSKAAALNRTQEMMRNDPNWSAPVHWAAWVLAGEAW